MPDTSTINISYKDFADGFVNLFKELGWAKSLTISLFFFFCITIILLMRALIKSKNQEIYRLRADNDKYRTIYLAGLDNLRGATPPSRRTSTSSPTPKKPKP